MSQNDTLTKLTPRQKRAIAALLAAPTIEAAARQAGISRKTLHRYLSLPAFRRALTEAQDKTLHVVGARLAGLLQRSLDVVGLDMSPGVDGATRLKAATAVMRHAAGISEFADLEQRVATLEQGVNNGES